LTASINGSPTISTLSYPQSASKPLLNEYNENKILVSRCISTKDIFHWLRVSNPKVKSTALSRSPSELTEKVGLNP
jgi:hypothetical protein